MSNNVNLLSSLSRVETPFVKVVIGDYVFGVAMKSNIVVNSNQVVQGNTYPNYIESLEIEKINGVVNNYTLSIRYAITQDDDPNFFNKVFSSVSKTRAITFEYGDMSAPSFCFRNEEAFITKVTESVSVQSSVVYYKVYATSKSTLLTPGSHVFRARYDKPSNVIKELLYESNDRYGLLEVFPGMTNRQLVELKGIIYSNDKFVNIEERLNISALEYIRYLVSCMKAMDDGPRMKNSFFSLVVMDDMTGGFGGAYFKVQVQDRKDDTGSAYELDIGFPSQNVVTDFRITTDESYALYYDFEEKLNSSNYVERIDDDGNLVEVYAPSISSGTITRTTTESQKTWWSNMTQFPIKASITIRGLLKPALLMSNVRLNVYFYGRKHISSGLYAVTSQKDFVGESGFRTTLTLLKVGGSSID